MLCALLLGITVISSAADILLEFKYAGKNVFVANPIRANGTFCSYTITVNGQQINLESSVSSSSFEIALDEMELKRGDAVTIVITHYEDCTPTILSTH